MHCICVRDIGAVQYNLLVLCYSAVYEYEASSNIKIKVELRFNVILIKLTKKLQTLLVLFFGELARFTYIVGRYIM